MGIGQEMMDDLWIQHEIQRDYYIEQARKGVWITADNRCIRITDMDDSHLINSYRYIQRGGQIRGVEHIYSSKLLKEIKKRGLSV